MSSIAEAGNGRVEVGRAREESGLPEQIGRGLGRLVGIAEKFFALPNTSITHVSKLDLRPPVSLLGVRPGLNKIRDMHPDQLPIQSLVDPGDAFETDEKVPAADRYPG